MSRQTNGPRLRKRNDRGGLWYIVWQENGGKRKLSTGTTEGGEANEVFAEWLYRRRRKVGPGDPSEILVTDCLNDYATEHAPTVAAPRVIGCAIKAMIPFWDGKTVQDVNPHTCARYVTWRGKSANTARRELAVLQAAINWSFSNGRLTRSVVVKLPAKPASKERWLTNHEAALLLRAALRSPQVRLYLPLFILIALYTGRRKEAILALRWHQVDLDRGVIDFRAETETNKRRGRVKIPRKLLGHLKRARRRGSDLGYVLHINGQRIGNIKKSFAAACKRAGLDDVTPHILKHTAASWVIQSGKSFDEAAEFLATSAKVLRETYAHLHPDHQQGVADALCKRTGSRMGPE
jgi:integrase